MEAANRNVWMDIGRVLAIYLVIVVHTSDTHSMISLMGVPLFVMLSGAILLSKTENYSEFWSKRLIRLLKPWIFWAVVISLFELSTNKIISEQFFNHLRSNFVTSWFLPMIFGLYLLTPALRIYVKSAKPYDFWGVIALWYMAVSILPYFRNTLAFPIFSDNGIVRQVLRFSGYYLLGYAISKQIFERKYFYFLLIGIGSLVTGIEGMTKPYFYDYQAPGIILLSGGVFGLLFQFRSYFQKSITGRAAGLIAILSKTSLGVYFVHSIILQYIPVNNLGPWIRGVILFGISFPIIIAFQKIPGLKKWVA